MLINGPMRVLVGLLFCIAASAQQIEVAGVAGYGAVTELFGDPAGIGAFGFSVGGPAAGRHAIRFDYRFVKTPERFRFDLHFLTASWVLQRRSGRARPYLRLGGGLVVQSFDSPPASPRLPAFDVSRTNTTGGGALGVGLTIDIGSRVFVRPEFETYIVRGPTAYLLPTVAVGVRF